MPTSNMVDETTSALLPTARLITALRDKDVELARELLNQPIDVNFAEANGVSLLMIAAYRGYADICERLIELGADVQHGFYDYYPSGDDDDPLDDREYDGVLERAKTSGDAKTLEVVERAFTRSQWAGVKANMKTDPDALVSVGTARLLDAARFGMLDLVADMVKSGVPIEDPEYFPEVTPLSMAATNGQVATCVLLVALGANPADLRGHRNIPSEVQRALEVIAHHMFGQDALQRPAHWDDRKF